MAVVGGGVFADTHGTTVTYCDEQQSVDRSPQDCCLAVVYLQAGMAPSSVTAVGNSQLTDIFLSGWRFWRFC